MVSAASKVPPSQASRRIARVDVYVDGRPARAIDAADGAVTAIEVELGPTGKTRRAVEAQAWDGAGRLAAVCRTSMR